VSDSLSYVTFLSTDSLDYRFVIVKCV